MRISRGANTGLSRREFLIMTSMAATGLATGCATNPVSGKSQFMIMDEQQEIAIDHRQSPHQLSADYGTVQDRSLRDYVQATGKTLSAHTHRMQMPYTFHCVNATYVNAYAFPGGSIATTRGILLEIDNEAELAALTGHELGHVNARHTAQQMSKGMITQVLAMGAAVYVGVNNPKYQELAMMLGVSRPSLSLGSLLPGMRCPESMRAFICSRISWETDFFLTGFTGSESMPPWCSFY